MNHEVLTLLRIRDEATKPMLRFIALLKESQKQVDLALGSLKRYQNALAPSVAALARQRESVGLVTKEAQLRTDMYAKQSAAADAMLAAQERGLAITKEQSALLDKQLAVARSAGKGGGVVPALKHAGSNLMWGGAGILGGMAFATQKAIDFDQTTLETDMALGGFRRSSFQRARDMAALQNAAFKGSQATGFFSAQEVMEGLQKAASSGMRPLVDKMGMGVFTKIVPTLAQYMDVLGRLKGESADTAALEAMQLVHMFGAYTPSAINKTLNGIAQLSLLMPDTMGKAISALSYVAPTGIQLAGMNVADIAAFVATADQSGLGRGRSGARLKDYIEAIAVVQSKEREKAKTALGIRGAIGPNGALDVTKSFDILIRDKARMSSQAFRDAVRVAFGAQGDVVAAMFGDAQKTGMFQANRAAIQGSIDRGDLTTVQNILKGGAQGREAAAWATLQNDIIKFGHLGIPIAVKFFDIINPKLQQFGDWMDKHPDQAKRLFDDLLHLGEGLLILGAAFKLTAGIWMTVNVVKTLFGAFGAVGPVIGTFATMIRTALIFNAINPAIIAVRALSTAMLGITAPVWGAITALTALMVLATTAKTGKDFDASNPAELQYELRRARDYGWYGIDPQERKNLWSRGMRPGSFPSHVENLHVENHMKVSLAPGTTTQQAKQIAALGLEMLSKGIQSKMSAHGGIVTHPNMPRFLSLDLAGQAAGTG